MIYIFSNDPQQVWQEDYLQTYAEFLPQIMPVQIVKADTKGFNEIHKLCQPGDYVWITHYADIARYDWSKIKAETIFRISGTSAHPWCYQVDNNQELSDFKIVDYMLSPHPNVTRLLEDKFYKDTPDRLAKLITTGYPMVNPKVRYEEHLKKNNAYNLMPSQRKNRLIVGGRLSPDKQPMLAFWLLQDIAKKCDVVFCYANDKELEWLEQYGGRTRWERLGYQFEKLEHEDFLTMLATSRYYFSCSLGDTMCYSAFEAISLDCYTILPDTMKHGTGLPHISCMQSCAYIYKAFDKRSVDCVFDEASGKDAYQKQDTTWTDPNRFIARLRDGLFGTSSYETIYGKD